MSATTGLGDRLKAVERELQDLRTERTEKSAEAERRKQEWAASDEDPKTPGPIFRRAKAATDAVAEIDQRISDARAGQVAILELLGGSGKSDAADSDVDVDRRDVEKLKSRDGAWLSHALAKRRDSVPHVRDELAKRDDYRQKAIETSDVGLVAESRAFFDLLSPASVVIASGVNVINIVETSVKVPRFTSLPTAAWTGERQPLPLSDPGLAMVESEPGKTGLVSVLSVEIFEDLSAELLAGIQRQILRAVAISLDTGLLSGSGTAPQPRGILQTTGLLTASGDLTNLAAFSSAIGTLIGVNASPRAVVLNPTDYTTLLGVPERTDSNVPLLVASGTQGFEVPYFPGLRWYLSSGVPAGTGLIFDPSAIAVVLRHPADLSLDPYFGFQTGEVAFRSYVRADIVVGQPDAVCVLDLTP